MFAAPLGTFKKPLFEGLLLLRTACLLLLSVYAKTLFREVIAAEDAMLTVPLNMCKNLLLRGHV